MAHASLECSQIEAALERVLKSAPFRNVHRLRRFLDFVVRMSLAGRGKELKEYTVGVAVYNRGIGFDPRCDGIVRVDGMNLRKRLQSYYQNEGLDDALVISLPRGGYVPHFEIRDCGDNFAIRSDGDVEEVCWNGRNLILRQEPENIKRAQQYFWKVIRRWPSSADAYTGLAEVILASMGIQEMSPLEGTPLLMMSAARALQLAPGSQDVQIYSAVLGVCSPDPQASDEALRNVLLANPRNAMAHFWAAGIHSARGENTRTLAHLQQATSLHPTASMFFVWGAAALYYDGKYSSARLQVLRAIDLDATDFMARFWLAMIAIELGLREEATEAAGLACQLSSSSVALAGLGYVLARVGRVEEAEDVLARLNQIMAMRYVAHSGSALILTALGRLSEAHRELMIAKQQQESILGWYAWDPRWNPLRQAVPSL